MDRDALRILHLTHDAPSPPRYGAQRRMHGLMTALASRNDLTVVTLADPCVVEEAGRALREYAREVVVIPRRCPSSGTGKRTLQLRSLLSSQSFEKRFLFFERGFWRAAQDLLSRSRFDVVILESPYLVRGELLRALRGGRRERLVLDSHNIDHDILRQVVRSEAQFSRRIFNGVNWRKVRHEERLAWRACDGVVLTSRADEAHVQADVPGVRTSVVPNAADVEFFRPRPGARPQDRNTLIFFGAMSYFPNIDGVLFFLREIWPQLAERRPGLRLQIVGPNPPPEILACAGPRVAVTGFVEDLRPTLARAVMVVVPLRIGGGTRLKIVEAMAMAIPVVSTRLGAEGIDVTDGADVVLADEPDTFAGAVERLLDDAAFADRIGNAGRALVEARYSWDAAGRRLEDFLHGLPCSERSG